MKCQCCNTKVILEDQEGWAYSICQECCWEQEPGCQRWPDDDCNPNNTSLNEAKQNYSKFGACNPHAYWMKTGNYMRGAN